jgi:hypothetical protein
MTTYKAKHYNIYNIDKTGFYWKMEATEARGGAMYVEYNLIECLLSYMNEGIPRSLYAPRYALVHVAKQALN